MQDDDVGRTYTVHTPEDGSWSALRAYSNPPEYTYYTYKLLERRVADEIALGVLSSFVEEGAPNAETVFAPGSGTQVSGSQPGVGPAMGETNRGPDEDRGGAREHAVVNRIRRKRRHSAPHAAASGHTL